jgi:hypothetical protein
MIGPRAEHYYGWTWTSLRVSVRFPACPPIEAANREDKMDEKFIIVWTVDGETTRIPHSTQDAALHQAEKLLREHGCDLEITLHLDAEVSPPPSIWFNKKRMRQWCLAGFPAVRI